MRALRALALSLAGCAHGTGILPMGPDTYTVKRELRSSARRSDDVRTSGFDGGERFLFAARQAIPAARREPKWSSDTNENMGADHLLSSFPLLASWRS